MPRNSNELNYPGGYASSDSSFNDTTYDRISPNRADLDLLRFEQLLDSSDSRIPILDDSYVHDIWSGDQYPSLEVQSSMDKPYLLLEFAASVILNVILCSNDFMFAIISQPDMDTKTDSIIRYIIAKVVNLSFVALVPFIFTTPDTYKSINVTVEYLAINIIIFEYDFVHILKYLGIQAISSIIGCLISIGLYFEYIRDLKTDQILPNVMGSSFAFNYSYVIVSMIVHTCIAAGLTVISNDASSINAKKKTLHKALLFFFCGLSFGSIIGPVGYMIPQVCLYSMLIISKGDYHLFNTGMFVAYVLSIIGILVFYPLMAVQIKFYWRNRYKRYIEYGSWK